MSAFWLAREAERKVCEGPLAHRTPVYKLYSDYITAELETKPQTLERC